MTSAADLLELQDIDLRRDARRALLADIETRLGETEELMAAREAVTSAEAELERLRREQRGFDEQREDLDAKIAPVETKLYDGSVRNPKELTNLQAELDNMKERRSALDDSGLALIETIEAANRAFAAAREELTRTQMYWEAEQEELKEDKERAEKEAAALESERGRWVVGMDPAVLGLYEALRPKKAGRAVARVDRNSCAGCRLTIPSQIVQRARAGTMIVQCPSCERILVGS